MSETTGIKILHAADFHLDSPFEALSATEAAARRGEQRQLLRRISEIAASENVDAVLFAGDLLDSDYAYLETAETLYREFESLGVPVFLAPGNHDYYSPRSPYAKLKLPENVHIFKSAEPTCVPLSSLGVRIWGAAFTSPASSPMLSGFEPPRGEGLLDIMVIHGEVSPRESQYNSITEDELRRSGMKYVALGHIHAFSGLRRSGETFYAWPGCPEGRGFDETGEKGVIIAEISAVSCELRFVPLGGRRYETVNVQVGTNALEAVLAALPERTENDIYRIILQGETDGLSLPALERALAPGFYHLELRDRTTIRRSVWERSGDEGLRGSFLTKLLKKHDSAKSEEERELYAEAAKWGLRALDNADET